MAEAIIFWDSVLNDIRKDLAKEVKNGSRTFYLEAAWSFASELFETVVLQADVVPGLWCDRKHLVESRQCRFSWMQCNKVFLILASMWTLWTGPWFRLANGHWWRALSRVWLLTLWGWISIYTLEAENVPILAGMNVLENHDISFRRNEFWVDDAEGHARSVPLGRSPSGHRILNLL